MEMPDLIALRAVFGQEEVNHGTARYRVGIDGLVIVPPEVAVCLINNGGFAVAKRTAASHSMPQPSDAQPRARVRLHHATASACSYGGGEYLADRNGDVLVPAEGVADLMAHGFVPVQLEEAWQGRGSGPAKPTPEAELPESSSSLGS